MKAGDIAFVNWNPTACWVHGSGDASRYTPKVFINLNIGTIVFIIGEFYDDFGVDEVSVFAHDRIVIIACNALTLVEQ